jgi:hypothetical protein
MVGIVTFVDVLFKKGYENIGVLDISANAT